MVSFAKVQSTFLEIFFIKYGLGLKLTCNSFVKGDEGSHLPKW